MVMVKILVSITIVFINNGITAVALPPPMLLPNIQNSSIFNDGRNRGAAFIGSPLILVPGDGGSQLEAKLNKTTGPHYICYKKTDYYYTLWLDLEQLLTPLVVGCWVDNMMLKYDNVTHTTSNADGVNVRVPGFGGTDTVDYLDPTKWSITQYFHQIIDMAVNLGYTKGKNIRGAPYDFRKSPNEFQTYYENMTKLIEETYYQNGNQKVIIVAHSMGNPVMLYFYHSKSQAWKDKFIRTHVSIAAPWGGSVKTLKLFASGYNLDHYRIIVNPLTVRPFQRSMTSSAYLLPSPMFWSPNETLIFTDHRNYTVADYKQFFDDLNYPLGYSMYEDTKGLFNDLKPPGVEVHCLCSVNMTTPDGFKYGKKSFPDTQPIDLPGDGDGTVNIRSCRGCLRWSGQQKQSVIYQEYSRIEHLDLLISAPVVNYIKQLLTVPPEQASRIRNMVRFRS